MKRLLIVAVALVMSVSALAAPRKAVWHAKDPIKGEYLVVLQDQGSVNLDAAVDGLARQHGAAAFAVMRHGVKAFGAHMNAQQAEAMANNPLVDHVEESAHVFLSYTVQEFGPGGTDTTWWHLDRIDNFGWPTSYHAYAWTSNGAGVNAYVLDTGVMASHQEFGGRVQPGVTFGDGQSATNPCGQQGLYENAMHGTAVASVIGGVNNGVAKGVTIIPVKVWNCDVNSPNITSSSVWWCWGLDWILGDTQSFANANKRAVVNISGGLFSATEPCNNGQGGTTPCMTAFENNVNNLVSHNVVVVAAANNFNNDHCDTSPARMGYGGTTGYSTPYHVITVGGSDETDHRWVRGADERWNNDPAVDPGSNFGTCVDIYAPAHHFQHLASMQCDTCYRTTAFFLSGTSYAAPVVTGMVARLLQKDPWRTPQQVWDYIRVTAAGPACFDFDANGNCRNYRLAYMSPYD